MKILFLNHHLHEAPILSTLRNLGVAAIVCSDLRECELVFRLHAASVTLFVGHDDDGLRMNEILKTNPRFARTPVILTTSRWSEQQCIDHQSTAMGANAYLRMPVEEKDFIHVVDEILGTALSHGQGYNVSDELSALVQAGDLEDHTRMEDLGLALAGAGLPIAAGAPDGPTRLEIVSPSEARPIAEDSTVVGDATLHTAAGLAIAPVAGVIQVEDAATVYGISAAELSEELPNLEAAFNLDAPSHEHYTGGSTPQPDRDSGTNGTKELRIEPMEGATQIVSEIVATPIEATQIAGEDFGALNSETLNESSDLEIKGLSPDEQPTRVAMTAPAPISGPEDVDAESLATMPYLGREGFSNPLAYREPMDDAVVPGGAATAPDVETLKKYLYLREQDVTALSAQLRQAREQIGSLETQLRHEKGVTSEFAHLAQEQDRRISGFDHEKAVALELAQKEIDELKFEMKRRTEKIRVMELQVKDATDATERLKERVRSDIRKIRTREKELENRLEIMKKDSEALLGSREQKIIELKRKLDLMEFNTDLLQEQLERERGLGQALRDKLAKAAQIVRVAGGLLSPEEEAMLVGGAVNDRTTVA